MGARGSPRQEQKRRGRGAMKGFSTTDRLPARYRFGTGVHTSASLHRTLSADGDTGLALLPMATPTAPRSQQTSWVTGVTLCTVLGDGNGAQIARLSICLQLCAVSASTTP